MIQSAANKHMASIYKDIYSIGITEETTFKEIFAAFDAIMVKYQVLPWDKSSGKTIGVTADYNMCRLVLMQYVNDKYMLLDLKRTFDTDCAYEADVIQQKIDAIKKESGIEITAYQPNETGYWAHSLERKAKYDTKEEALEKGIDLANDYIHMNE